jgi:hypothetical protein
LHLAWFALSLGTIVVGGGCKGRDSVKFSTVSDTLVLAGLACQALEPDLSNIHVSTFDGRDSVAGTVLRQVHARPEELARLWAGRSDRKLYWISAPWSRRTRIRRGDTLTVLEYDPDSLPLHWRQVDSLRRVGAPQQAIQDDGACAIVLSVARPPGASLAPDLDLYYRGRPNRDPSPKIRIVAHLEWPDPSRSTGPSRIPFEGEVHAMRCIDDSDACLW